MIVLRLPAQNFFLFIPIRRLAHLRLVTILTWVTRGPPRFVNKVGEQKQPFDWTAGPIVGEKGKSMHYLYNSRIDQLKSFG